MAPGSFLSVLTKKYSPTTTVLPPQVLVLHHCSSGPCRPCICPSLLCWTHVSICISAEHHGLCHCPSRHYDLVSALMGTEISAFLDIISPSFLPGRYHQCPRALMVPKCNSGQLQMMGRPFAIWHLVMERVNCFSQSLPDCVEHQLFQNVLSATLMSTGYEHSLSLPSSLLWFHTYSTQWLGHINASVKVFWMNGWVQWELGWREYEDSLPATKVFVLDTWTLPGSFSHLGESTQEVHLSPVHSAIWQKSPSNLPVMPKNLNDTIRQEARKSLLSYFPS